MVEQVAVGALLAALIAGAGYARHARAVGGAVAAVVVGTAVFGLGGWVWGVVMILFFVSSSALSHYREREKKPVAAEFAKTGQRDANQVCANGGVGAVLAV